MRVLMYISQTLSYKPRKDLQIYCPKKLKLLFIKLVISNKPNFAIGAMYKDPLIEHYKFKYDLQESLLLKIQIEKEISINIKYSQAAGINQFLEIIPP